MAVTFFLGGLVRLPTMSNSLSNIPALRALYTGAPSSSTRREALRACHHVFLSPTVGLFAGVAVLEVCGISCDAFRIAGPGALATLAGIAVTCLVIWLLLRSARWSSCWLGREGFDVVSRFTAFLQVCTGLLFVGSGVRTFMAGA